MSNRNNDESKISITRIETSDTISQFMEKCNNNFSNLLEFGGGTKGDTGKKGDQGVPTKPKVPIHVWKKGDNYEFQYRDEIEIEGKYFITDCFENLTDVKYQEGHLIILENAHVYILKTDIDSGILKPTFLVALQSYNPKDVINGKTAYVHIAYADNIENFDGFITNDELQLQKSETEPVTYNLQRNNNINVSEKPYMGIYSDNNQSSSTIPTTYTWIRIQGFIGLTGPQGVQGPKGEKGDTGEPGDGYTGQQYSVDLDGDMSTISLNENRTCLYSTDDNYCECIVHAYYGAENKKISLYNITIDAPNGYIKDNNNNIIKSNDSNTIAGQITLSENGNDISIKFTPDRTFIFPETPIIFPIHIKSNIHDDNDGKTYTFNRDTIWTIKGVVSNFELEIIPQYRTIKRYEDGTCFPQNLLASVYKTVNGERTLFNFKDSPFTFLYKNNDSDSDESDEWTIYQNEGIPTINSSCIEFKVVKNYGSTSPETPEEIWDYEDVWVVADGKSTHYYHADLGNVESMMVFTTGVEKIIETKNGQQKCAELRNESGYSITFNPKFYDGTNEIEVTNIGIGSNSGEEYYQNGEGSFMYKLKGNTLTITRVPFKVEMIPMTIVVNAEDGHSDSITFNIYISTINNIYTLSPSTTAYNTSTGKTGDTIGCSVYKNNEEIEISELGENGLNLKYVVYSGGTDTKKPVKYTEPLVYGEDSDMGDDEFAASDVAIVFILYYDNKEIARSTVPLIKDGIDGEDGIDGVDGVDGDCWQYIFCRSNKYPFAETGISNPSLWYTESDEPQINPYEEYIPEEYKGIWFDDHQGVDKNNKYEYQSYRKWDKITKCWGTYGEPTLYSNYSKDGKDGSGYNVMLSNPVSVIPVGHDDWSANENSDNQKDYTFIYLYNNTTDITSETDDTGKNKVSISLPEDNIYVQRRNFTVDNNTHKVSFIPVVGEGDNKSIFDFQSNTQYKLPITLEYNLGKDIDGDGISDIFTTTINWTLTPIKGLEDFEVFVDKRVVNTSVANTHELKVGYYSISSSGGKKFIGNKDKENVYGYDIILTSDIKSITSTSPVVSNWQRADYNFVKNGENINCYVVLTKINNESVDIIDYVNVTAINDGKDGKSAIHLELVQDYIELPSINGYIPQNYSDDKISSRMLLYNGDKLIEEYDKIIYSFKINGELVDENDIFVEKNKDTHGRFTIPKELINGNGNTNIECIATYNGVSYHKILYICLEERPFELSLNKNVLTRDANLNRIIDKELSVRVNYWDYDQGKWVPTRDGEVRINSINGKENQLIDIDHINEDVYDRKIVIENSNIAKNDKDTEFRISYYINEEELTYEILGVINSGLNGKDGKSISVAGTFSTEEELRRTFPYGPDSIDDAYIVGEDLYIWENGDWVNLGQFRGKDGAQVYLHIKYANSISYDLDGKTISSVVWTDEDGEVKGPYQGMYSDYIKEDSNDFTKYKWFQIDAEKAVQTEIGKYQITSNTISGKTMQSTTNVSLIDGTQLEYFDDDGKSLGKTTASGGRLGPAWQLNNQGEGYLAQGNIRWDAKGNVRFGENVKLDWNTNIDNAPDISGDGLTQDDVENIISTEISKYEVKAENITGSTLSGKTLKSSSKISGTDDATWQINNEGDGWLANKNINWDANGELTINGTISGSVGKQGENPVTIDGDLVIKSNDKPSMILSGEHKYENPNDINTKNRNITLSSGFCDTLYKWELNAVATISSEIGTYIPNIIYTKYKYSDIKNGSNVSELYYKTEDNDLFVWMGYDSATVNSKTVSTGGTYNDGAYISVKVIYTDGSIISYIYNYTSDDSALYIGNNTKLQAETSNTNIYSDGTIYTNSIVANDGQYYGSIYSNGEFSGKLINVSGSINDTSIKNADITLTHNNNFIATSNNSSKYYCPICDMTCNLFQYWDGGKEMMLNNDYMQITLNYNNFHDFLYNIDIEINKIVSSFNLRGNAWADLTQGGVRDLGVFICNDLRAVKDCDEEEFQFLQDEFYGESLSLTKEDLIRAGFENYPMCIFHLYRSDESCLISKSEAFKHDTTIDIFRIMPYMDISGDSQKIQYSSNFWDHTEKTSDSSKTISHKFSLAKINVGKDTSADISKITIKIIGYQTKKEYIDSTNPFVRFYWKYNGDIDADAKLIYSVGNGGTYTFRKQNEKYNGKQYDWVKTTPARTIPSNSTKFEKSGEIEIYAVFSANLSPKQLADYPYISCSLGDFTIETKTSFDAYNNTITVTKSGAVIKAQDGGELSTIGNNLSITSSNKNYSIKVTDNGIELWNNGVKTLLSDLINNVSTLLSKVK